MKERKKDKKKKVFRYKRNGKFMEISDKIELNFIFVYSK